MRIAIGAPGNGALLKDALEERLVEDGRVSDVLDLSTPEITYPEVSFQVARAVAEGRADRGLLICGTGVGEAISSRRVPMALSAASTCVAPIGTSSRSLSTGVPESRPGAARGNRVQIGYKRVQGSA